MQVVGVKLAESSIDAFRISSSIWKWTSVHKSNQANFTSHSKPSSTNKKVFPRRTKEYYARVHELQSVGWKKANASKLFEREYVYVPQSKADNQKKKIPFTDLRWTGPYIVGKALPSYIFGQYSQNGQNAGASSHETRTVHA